MRLSKIAVAALMIITSTSSVADEFIINLPQPIETETYSIDIKNFFTEVYSSIGIEPTFIFTSANRGFKLLKLNKIQAEGYRTTYVGDQLGSEYKLKAPISNVKLAVFCKEKERCNISTHLSYAVQTGFSFGEFVCESLKIQCKYARTPAGIGRLLDTGLTDGVISPYPAYDRYLCLSQTNTFYFSNLSQYSFNIHHYTNVSDVKLRAAIEQSLINNASKYSTLFSRYKNKPNLEHCNKQLLKLNPFDGQVANSES